jgi:tight adherence protein B
MGSLLLNEYLVVVVLVFVAATLGVEALFMLWGAQRGPKARKLLTRLQTLSAVSTRDAPARLLKQRMTDELPAYERLLLKLPRVDTLDRFLQQSGLDWSVARLLAGSAVLGLLIFVTLIGPAHRTSYVALLGAAAAAALPFAFVGWRRKRRLAKVEQQLPEALDLIARALRAGHAFSSALKMAGEELPEPIGDELRATHEQINFGISMQQALLQLSERVPLTDVRYFVVAVLIQRDAGGNLTEILGNLSRLVRERLKLQARVRVLSSEGRLSAWVLTLMPFGLAALMYAFNPKFMGPLWTDPIGIAMLNYLLTMMAIGVFLLRRITHIRY